MTERNVPNLEKNTTFILLHSGLRVNKEKEKTYIYIFCYLSWVQIFYVLTPIYMKMMPMPLQGQL